MATYHRLYVLIAVTIAVSISGVIHYRIGVAHLYPLATTDFSGPFSSVIPTLEWMVPLVLVIIELGTIAWAITGGVQEERARVQRGRL